MDTKKPQDPTISNDKSEQTLRLFDISKCSAPIRSLAKKAVSIENLAESITKTIYEQLATEPDEQKACALVRLFRTVRYQDLNPELKKKARTGYLKVNPTSKFLVLLGTAGFQPDWNSRKSSKGHQLIPLLSADIIAKTPMIARLFSQLGFEISALLNASSTKIDFADPADRDYNMFFVQDAKGSQFIPSQTEFVIPCGIRSVVGYGSLLPDGEVYAVVMFFRVLLPETALKRFIPLALSTTIALLSAPEGRLFSDL
jgi:two-component system NtrC family sensor kinase